MERVRRLQQLWTWLPAFRAVAETENLQHAARLLHLTPSALSRSIRLLEQELGQSLFVRSGRHLNLNSAGRALLGYVRDAMRLLDEGLESVQKDGPARALSVGADGELAEHILVCALVEACGSRPTAVRRASSAEISAMLLRGQLDLALVESEPVLAPPLMAELAGTVSYGIYGRSQSDAFVVTAGDRWPPERSRRVVMQVVDLRSALEICASTELCAVLPDLLVARSDVPRREALSSAPLYVVRRKPLRPSATLDGLAAAIVRSVSRRAARPSD